MDIVRNIISVALFLFFAICVIGNDIVIPFNYYIRKQSVSLIPIVGGLSGFLAMLIVPINKAWMWSWIPLFLDIGCIPSVAVMLFEVYILRNRS